MQSMRQLLRQAQPATQRWYAPRVTGTAAPVSLQTRAGDMRGGLVLQRILRSPLRPVVRSVVAACRRQFSSAAGAARASNVIVSTREQLHGSIVLNELGMVCETQVRQVSARKTLLSRLYSGMFGGSVQDYAAVQIACTRDATQGLQAEASKLGPHVAVIRTRFESCPVLDAVTGSLYCQVCSSVRPQLSALY